MRLVTGIMLTIGGLVGAMLFPKRWDLETMPMGSWPVNPLWGPVDPLWVRDFWPFCVSVVCLVLGVILIVWQVTLSLSRRD